MRRLISIRRRVPAARGGDYDALWTAIVDAARARGANAWRFRAADEPDTFMEFLEMEGPGPIMAEELRAAMHALDRALEPERTDRWEEAP